MKSTRIRGKSRASNFFEENVKQRLTKSNIVR
uniref:Uncharacterized protein n=1 Tax=Siphoviridae sp. ctVOP12 TaxID=2825531 RepID=A0A8S5V9Z3_9CAUD|nr:MAG TPA: hypothetical protein [Siphoviridae sp. ctVOP12]